MVDLKHMTREFSWKCRQVGSDHILVSGETKVEHWWSMSEEILESAFSHGRVSFSGCLTDRALTLRETPLSQHHTFEVTLQSPQVAVENQVSS